MNTNRFFRISVQPIYIFVLSLIISGCASGQPPTATLAPTLVNSMSTSAPTPTLAPTMTPTSLVTTPAPLAASDVRAIASEFEKIGRQQADAWNSHDLDALRQIYTEDIVNYDGYPRFAGSDSILSMAEKYFTVWAPNYEERLVETYFGHTGGVAVSQIWNVGSVTKEHPALEYDLLKIRDGRIWYWRVFYDPEFISRHGVNVNTALLKDYATAWSSGDPKKVAALYAEDAQRDDLHLADQQQGRDSIQSMARDFFTWYPNMRLELLQPFGENLPNTVGGEVKIALGGIYAIHVSDAQGNPCDVRALVILETSKAGIASEQIFYNADSMISCSWARD